MIDGAHEYGADADDLLGRIFGVDDAFPKPTPAAKPLAAKPASTPNGSLRATPAQQADAKRFIAHFGAELGFQWFAEGKTFEQAQGLHQAKLKSENEKLKTDLAAANRRLSEVGAKLETATSVKVKTAEERHADYRNPNRLPGEDDDTYWKRQAVRLNLNTNQAKLAMGMNLPTK